MDAPVVLRGMLTAFLARGSAKSSIGRVFQERAARYGDHIFIRFEDEALTYHDANQTVNRYAAMLAERGVGRGDVVGIINAQFAAHGASDARGGQTRRYRRHAEPQASATTCWRTASGYWMPRSSIGEDDLLSAVDESGADVADTLTVDEFGSPRCRRARR